MNGRRRKTWEETAIKLAYTIADCRSEDPYVQVGACVVKKKGFGLSVGYNGAPTKVDIDWSDRDERRKKVLHAETNILNWVLPGEVEFLAITHLPCPECIKAIAQKGIKKIIYSELMDKYDNDLTFQLAKIFDIEVRQLSIDSKPKSNTIDIW
jgi:dCMP deaminase